MSYFHRNYCLLRFWGKINKKDEQCLTTVKIILPWILLDETFKNLFCWEFYYHQVFKFDVNDRWDILKFVSEDHNHSDEVHFYGRDLHYFLFLKMIIPIVHLQKKVIVIMLWKYFCKTISFIRITVSSW